MNTELGAATRYSDYSKDVTGWFLGLTGAQLTVIVLGGLPLLAAINARDWWLFLGYLPAWASLAAVVAIRIGGRSAAHWFSDLALFAVGGIMGWTKWQSNAAAGIARDLSEADLPGVLAGVRTHDGPPFGQLLTRPAIVQDHARRTWAAVARVVHPGIGLAEQHDRDRMAAGLAELQEIAARAQLIDMIALQVRTVPDDGAERDAWVTSHTRAGAHSLPLRVNALLTSVLTPAAVRSEAFVTVVVREDTISRAAKESGGGVDGRA
ncbi:MAG TPA: SCO6880 family protein, partial [Acidothermaceae bacterium]